MEEINEIKIPKGVDSISVRQHDDKIVIEFIPENPQFKDGDFVYEDNRIMIVKSYPNNYHANTYPDYSDSVHYSSKYGLSFSSPTFRHATEEEKKLLIDAMKKDGKRWNAEKLEIEDIEYTPQHKFKAGDVVKIKDGISSKTHRYVSPNFTEPMDEFIGKELMVKGYSNSGFVVLFGDYFEYHFAENWLEPYTNEPKNGDLAIFWDCDKDDAVVRLYNGRYREYHYDNSGRLWDNAIKFESKEQFEKILSGKI